MIYNKVRLKGASMPINGKYKVLVRMFNKELNLVLPYLFFEPA